MNSHFKHFSKSTLAIVLTVCMLITCMTVGIVTTDAAKIDSESVGYGSIWVEAAQSGATTQNASGSLTNNAGYVDIDFSGFTVNQNVTCKLKLDNDYFGNGVNMDQGGNYGMSSNGTSSCTFNVKVKKQCTVRFSVSDVNANNNPPYAKLTTTNQTTAWYIIGGKSWGTWSTSNVNYELTETGTNTGIYERAITTTQDNVFFRVHNGTKQFNGSGNKTNTTMANDTWYGLKEDTDGAFKISTAGNYTVRVNNADKKIMLIPEAKHTFTVPALKDSTGTVMGTVTATYKGQTKSSGETFTEVPAGSNIVLSLNPPTGKKVTDVTCDGATVTGGGNSWSVTMPANDVVDTGVGDDWTFTITDQGTVTVYFNNIKTQYAKPKAYAWYGSDDRSSVTAEFTEAWTGTAMTRLPNSNIWYIENIPADAKITFVGDNGVNTGKLDIPSGNSAPRYNPGSDPGSPATGGSWSTYTPRYNEVTVSDGSTLGESKNSDLFHGLSATMYDYYVDGEIPSGRNLTNWISGIGTDSSTQGREYSVHDGSKFNWNPYQTLNSAISQYSSDNSVTYPLYFGNLNTNNITDNGVKDYHSNNGMKPIIEGYFNWNNAGHAQNCSVFLSNSHNAATGLTGVTLAGSTIHHYKQSGTDQNGAPMAMFDEDFLSGENNASKALATILRVSTFPVRKTTEGGTSDTVWFDPNGKWGGDQWHEYVWGWFYGHETASSKWVKFTKDATTGLFIASGVTGYTGVTVVSLKDETGMTNGGTSWGSPNIAYNNNKADTAIVVAEKAYIRLTAYNTAENATYSGDTITITGGHDYYQFDSTDGNDNVFIKGIDKDAKTATIDYYRKSDNKIVYTENADNTTKYAGFCPFDWDHLGSDSHAYDLGFGMKLEIPFTVSANGLNDDGTHQVFEFSGDDDLWVFIDGKLVLDLGGDHLKTEGKIDFSDCSVTAEKTQAVSSTYTRNGKFGTDVTGGWFNNNSPNTPHTMTIYYMERGMFDSNLKFGFSFKAIPNQFKAEKKIKTDKLNSGLYNTEVNSATKSGFVIDGNREITWFEKSYHVGEEFTVEHKAGTQAAPHTVTPISGKTYTVMHNVGDPTEYTMGQNGAPNDGTYKLKRDDMAYFLGQFPYDSEHPAVDFNLKEISPSTNKYKYDQTFAVYDDANNSTEVTTAAQADNSYTFAFQPTSIHGMNVLNLRARFTNTMKYHDLVLTKEVNDPTDTTTAFTLQILVSKMDGSTDFLAYPLTYSIDGVPGALPADGKVTIKPGQYLTIPSLPEGLVLKVTEVITDENAYGYSKTTLTKKGGGAVTTTAAGKGVTFTMPDNDVTGVVKNVKAELYAMHELHPDSVGGANCFVKVEVKNADKTVTRETYDKTSGTIEVEPKYLKRDSTDKLIVTLETEPNTGYTLEGFYDAIAGEIRALNATGAIYTITTNNVGALTAVVEIPVSSLFNATTGDQDYTVLPFYSKLQAGQKNFTISKKILDDKTSTEDYTISINTKESLDASAAATPYKGPYTVVHTEGADTEVGADASRATCVVTLKQNEQIKIAVTENTYFEITEVDPEATIFHYNHTKVDGTEVTADVENSIVKLDNGVLLKVQASDTDKTVDIWNKARGYKLQYFYHGYLTRYDTVAESGDGQWYTITGLFNQSDFDETTGDVQLVNNGSAYEVQFRNDAKRKDFITRQAPYQDNFLQGLTWDPKFEGDGTNSTYAYTAANVGQEMVMTTKAIQSDNRIIYVYFNLPYAVDETDNKLDPVESEVPEDEGKILKIAPSTYGRETIYGNWFTTDGKYYPEVGKYTAKFATAPKEIYQKVVDGDTVTYQKYIFRYWKMETVNEGSARNHNLRNVEEYKRCYFDQFNMTFYQDTIVTPVYEAEGAADVELSPSELEARDTEGGNGVNITFLENSRNQWNDNGGVEQEAHATAAKKNSGDRVYCDFLLSFAHNDNMLQSPLGKLKTEVENEGEEDETTVTTFVPYKINGTEVYYSGGIVIETVGEMEDENNDEKIDEKDILTQAQYRTKYGYDNTLSGKVEKYLNGQSDHGLNLAITDTFSAKGFDNKNQFEYSTSFANRQHGNLSVDRPWKTKVYRAYTYLRDYNGSTATASSLTWDGSAVTSETEISSIKSHSGALIKVSMPVYFTIYEMASIQDGAEYNGQGES